MFVGISLIISLLCEKLAKNTKILNASEEKYRLISENTIDCIWQMNLDLEFTYINEAVFPLFGYTPEEYIGSKLPEHCSSEELEKMQAIIVDLLDSLSDKTMEVFETSIYHKNGEEIPCEISGTVVLDNAGNPLYAQGVTRVITERKKAEKDLRDSKEKLEQAIQGNSIPTYIIDSNHIITNWNNACESLTGFSEAQMVGTKKHWLPFYPEERPNLVDLIIDGATKKEIDGYYEDKINKSILVKGAYEGERFYPDLGEKGKWLFSTAAPLRNHHGDIIGAIETIQDITDRRNAEEQLRQAQKMESVGRLAGGVAHDYNNALTAIMGYTELALMDADPAGPLHADLNQVLKAGRRAQDITRQLLAFARKQTIAPIALNLNQTVESMIKMLRRLIGEDIDLAWLPETNLWHVMMDPSQIDQILANLCVNSRDAIEGVGKVTIETATKVFDSAYCADHVGFVPGEFVQLSVSDNGCGMDKEILKEIFEPFFTTKAVDKGTGLGLSTVYGIVKQNNGFINVYSEPGKGTTIKIYLPRHEGKAVEIQEENTTEIPQGRGETILLVEDDLPILKLAQKILEGLNYTVLIADTPKGAMRLAQEHTGKIHLLITDVIMPEMNGRELSEQLQSLSPDLKCIFMSGYTANAIAHHGVLDEGVHFIQKPFSKRDLATIVRKVLDRE
ncbi:MAG: PAS domain S-box protein [Proteobacteria bacterium]|nr:PAS domain S-box protein [Pseudomonadota bacterium]